MIVGRVGEPLRRPRTALEVFLAANLTFLALDVLFAHAVNSFREPAEWVPLWFSLAGGGALFGLLLARGDPRSRASWLIGGGVGLISIGVGVVGCLLHLRSPFLLGLTPENLVYSAPFVAPLAYAGIGGLLLLNRFRDMSGAAWGRWVIRFAAAGFAGNFVLALLDHEQNGFAVWTEWIPVVAAALAVGTLAAEGAGRGSGRFLAPVLIVQAAVGVVGFVLHLRVGIHASGGHPFEALIHGAPPFAPLLFADLALLGGIARLAPRDGEPLSAGAGPRPRSGGAPPGDPRRCEARWDKPDGGSVGQSP